MSDHTITDEDLAFDRALAQQLALKRSPEEQRRARAEFARQAARSEFGSARRRRA